MCQHSELACKEIAGELEDIARWLSNSDLSPRDFQRAVTTLEARKLQRFGFELTSTISEDKWVHFTLRFEEYGELCARMDINPATGEMSVQHTCV